MAIQRCRWCGRFLPLGTEPTTRSLLRIGWNKEENEEGWRTVQQLLCEKHAADWSIDMPWNKAPDMSLPLEILGSDQDNTRYKETR
jgi:hypothetical protein